VPKEDDMEIDHKGGQPLARRVLAAAGRGDQETVATLIAPLGVDQLRSLVTVLATEVDQVAVGLDSSGPRVVCGIAVAAAARAFDTSPEAILGPERTRTVSEARAVAMTAAREAGGLTLTVIAEHFNKDHSSVLAAVRRTHQNPRLNEVAERVEAHVHERYTRALSTEALEHAGRAAARAFGTEPAALMGSDLPRAASDARAVAMTAARLSGHSLTGIAGHFGCDHSTVLHAVRRIENTPPLRVVATQIAGALAADGRPTFDPATRPEPSGPRLAAGVRRQQQAVVGGQAQANGAVAR